MAALLPKHLLFSNLNKLYINLFTRALCSNPRPNLSLNLKPERTAHRYLHSHSALLKDNRISLTFVTHDGIRATVQAKVGETILDAVVNNSVDLKGYGACEGTLSCSTCHVIFKPDEFEKMGEFVTEEELDMLDVAIDVCETSRLGCQVVVTEEMDGMELKVPAAVRDARETSCSDTV